MKKSTILIGILPLFWLFLESFAFDYEDHVPIGRSQIHDSWTEYDESEIEGYASQGYPGCGKAPLNQLSRSSQGYIINGTTQKYGEWPQYVRLIRSDGVSCGGTLVSNRHVLTAAHCTSNMSMSGAESFQLIFGDHNKVQKDKYETVRRGRPVCLSPRYIGEVVHKWVDWALIKFDEPIKFSDHIQPACMPTKRYKTPRKGPKSICFVVGAGAAHVSPDPNKPGSFLHKSKDELQKMRVVETECSPSQRDEQLCARKLNGGTGSFSSGDSGGPILCLAENNRWVVVGIVSYLTGYSPDSIQAYTRVDKVLKEIIKVCPRS